MRSLWPFPVGPPPQRAPGRWLQHRFPGSRDGGGAAAEACAGRCGDTETGRPQGDWSAGDATEAGLSRGGALKEAATKQGAHAGGTPAHQGLCGGWLPTAGCSCVFRERCVHSRPWSHLSAASPAVRCPASPRGWVVLTGMKEHSFLPGSLRLRWCRELVLVPWVAPKASGRSRERVSAQGSPAPGDGAAHRGSCARECYPHGHRSRSLAHGRPPGGLQPAPPLPASILFPLAASCLVATPYPSPDLGTPECCSQGPV